MKLAAGFLNSMAPCKPRFQFLRQQLINKFTLLRKQLCCYALEQFIASVVPYATQQNVQELELEKSRARNTERKTALQKLQ